MDLLFSLKLLLYVMFWDFVGDIFLHFLNTGIKRMFGI